MEERGLNIIIVEGRLHNRGAMDIKMQRSIYREDSKESEDIHIPGIDVDEDGELDAEVNLEESVWSVMRQGNEREYQGEGVHNSGKTSIDVRGRDVKKVQENKLEVAEMRMLRWMCRVTKLDKIRNERIRGTTKVGEITKNVQEMRSKWHMGMI